MVVLVATLVATSLLILGILELVWPTRRPARRRVAPSAARGPRGPAAESPLRHRQAPSVPVDTPRADEMAAHGAVAVPPAPIDAVAAASPTSEVTATAELAAEQAAAGDPGGAVATLRTATAALPDDLRESRREELVSAMVRALLARAGRDGLATLAVARDVLAAAVADAPDPARFAALAEDVADRYWAAYETAVTLRIDQRHFTQAYELVDRAAAEPNAPRARVAEWRARAVRTEVGVLAADAIRAIQEGRDEAAVASLAQAETLLATVAGDVIEAGGELERRLWRAHMRLGLRRIDGGDNDGALTALYRALELAGAAGPRREETCEAIARAVGGVVEERAPVIRDAATDRRESAREQAEQLSRVVQRAVDAGVPATAVARSRAVVQELVDAVGG